MFEKYKFAQCVPSTSISFVVSQHELRFFFLNIFQIQDVKTPFDWYHVLDITTVRVPLLVHFLPSSTCDMASLPKFCIPAITNWITNSVGRRLYWRVTRSDYSVFLIHYVHDVDFDSFAVENCKHDLLTICQLMLNCILERKSCIICSGEW